LNLYGFEASKYDEGAFINKYNRIILLCYIDDIIVSSPNNKRIQYIMNEVSKHIKLQLIGEVDTFLGIQIKIDRDNNTLYIH